MTAQQVIQVIETLPPDEQAKVVRFVYRLDSERRLSGKELTALAERLAVTNDPSEAATLKGEIVRGFYGNELS